MVTRVMCDYCDHPQHPNGACQQVVADVNATILEGRVPLGCCGCQHYTIRMQTKPCLHCGKTSVVPLDYACFKKWQEGTLVQNAFPNMSADEREMLITGTHPKCWDEMLGPEDPDEEE